MRSPRASAAVIASRITFTAKSASLATSCGKRAVSLAIRSDLVISVPGLLLRVAQLGLEQRAEAGRAGRGGTAFGRQLLPRIGLFRLFLGLDRKIDRPRLAVDVDDHRLDTVTFLEQGTQIVDAIARGFGTTQIGLDVVAQIDHGTLGIDALHRAL